MSNACYFDMKIAGEEPAVMEFARMMKGGFGQVTAFELNEGGIERDPRAGSVALSGQGSCVKSVAAAMLANDGYEDLYTETERLGLAVEVFASEPSSGFQEHLLMDRGILAIDETASYQEIFVDWSEPEDVQELLSETGLSKEELEAKVNEYGELWIGGFENYGQFQDLFPLLNHAPGYEKPEVAQEPLESLKNRARERAAEKSIAPSEKRKTQGREHDL